LAPSGLPALPEQSDRREPLDPRESQDLSVLSDPPAWPGPLVPLDLPEFPDLLAPSDRRELSDLLERSDRPAPPDRPEL
jgi:hypothetical protein